MNNVFKGGALRTNTKRPHGGQGQSRWPGSEAGIAPAPGRKHLHSKVPGGHGPWGAAVSSSVRPQASTERTPDSRCAGVTRPGLGALSPAPWIQANGVIAIDQMQILRQLGVACALHHSGRKSVAASDSHRDSGMQERRHLSKWRVKKSGGFFEGRIFESRKVVTSYVADHRTQLSHDSLSHASTCHSPSCCTSTHVPMCGPAPLSSAGLFSIVFILEQVLTEPSSLLGPLPGARCVEPGLWAGPSGQSHR